MKKVTIISTYKVTESRDDPHLDPESRKIEPESLKNKKGVDEYFEAYFLPKAIYNKLGKPDKIKVTETIEIIE